jgi:hypothetical protein
MITWLWAGWLRDQGSIPRRGKRYSLLGNAQTQPSIQWVLPAVKWVGHEADYSLASSAEVKNMWLYASTPMYIFMA